MKCLLCGYTGDSPRAGTSLACCSWCTEEAASLQPEEAAALVELERIEPAFQIWSRGRREESGSGCFSKAGAPIVQPALIYPGLPLYIGDMDDAMDIQNLQVLGIGCVVNLCADMLGAEPGYRDLPGDLGRAGIHQHIFAARDSRSFDIIHVAELARGAMSAALGGATRRGVLVHCWGGVNRSAAVATFFLTAEWRVPLVAAVAQLMERRGTVLTNQSFRKQLVRYCFKTGLA